MVTILFQKYDIVCGIPKKTSKKKKKKEEKQKSQRIKRKSKRLTLVREKGGKLQEVHTSHIHLPMKSPTDQNHSSGGNLKHAPQKVQKVSHPHSSIVPKYFFLLLLLIT
jgi:hypothetical protein